MPTLEEKLPASQEGKVTSAQKPLYEKIKRVFDCLCALTGLLILWPGFLVIALVIYLDDPHGSPLFSQVRVGKGGEMFRLYKFRTMVKDAEQEKRRLLQLNEMDGPAFKVKNDPRITRAGGFLRKTGLDELPQLYNVLRGEMSLVGPRPPLPEEVRSYTQYQRQRLLVTPGLTCTWQIMPHRNTVAFSRWVEMDLEYIEKRSVWLDLKLILKTPAAMLHKNGQ